MKHKALGAFTLVLYSMMFLLDLTQGQPTTFVNPDFYFDLSQVSSAGSSALVVDQVTNNPMNAFTFAAARQSACFGAGLISPTVGPDGITFNQQKQAVRIQYAQNIDLQSQFMIAFWVKSYFGISYSPTPRNETLMTQARYDNRNDTPYQFSIGLMSNGSATAKLGLRFSAFLFNATSGYYQYVEYYFQNTVDIQDGWALIVLGVDNLSVPSATTVYLKAKTSSQSNKVFTSTTFSGLTWLQRSQELQDIYLGAWCDLYGTQNFGSPFRGVISRVYIWRSITGPSLFNDLYLDKYFFRVPTSTSTPTCTASNITGTIMNSVPCTFCAVAYNPPTSMSDATVLPCLSSPQTYAQAFIAYWDFNTDPTVTQKFIADQSGNGYNLYMGTLSSFGNNDPFRIPGQGYLFEKNMFAQGSLPILLHNFPAITWDIWIRRESIPSGTTGTNAFAFLIDRTVGGIYTLDFGIQISDTNQKILVTLNNLVQSSPQYSNVFVDGTWSYFAVSLYNYQVTQNSGTVTNGCRLRFMSGTANMNSVVNCLAAYTGFAVNIADAMSLISYRSYIFNRMRIYQEAMSIDDIPQMVETTCTKKIGQSQCSICPENGLCLTVCSTNQYEDPTNQSCIYCDPFCGGCYGPGHSGCSFCTRTTPSLIYYSQLMGNCTCLSGYYYNSTNDDCQLCNENCIECFGPTKTECLTCSAGMIFYPPTNCISTCNDPLVVGNGQYGFFKSSETVGGAGAFEMCISCHPYCTVCYGTQVTQCTACQNGFFLQGTACIDNCPDHQYADMLLKSCQLCHGDCLKCSSPAQNKCTQCYQAVDGSGNVIQLKYLQTGNCYNQCNSGYYPDLTQTCQTCHPSCMTCTTSRNTTCGSCTSGFYLQWLGFSCMFGCMDGQYSDDATNMCLLCHYSCGTCSGAGPDQCKVCALSYLRSQSLCVESCKPGQFIVKGECLSCNQKCLTCYGPYDYQCYTCAPNTNTGLGFYYYNQKCTTECPLSYYPDNLMKVCTKCLAVCGSCLSSTFCTSCIPGPYLLNSGECNYFSCMDSQYLSVTPSLACFDCDPSCLTCRGMSSFDCLSCLPNQLFVDNTCVFCDQLPGMTNAADPSFPGCVEICGDGFNFHTFPNECDDGNLLSGDGCDSKCFVEAGWACIDGSPTMADSCRDIQPPTPRISLINSLNQIHIAFDEEMILTESIMTGAAKLSLSVVGNQPSYQFDWEVPPTYTAGEHLQNIIINLKFYLSLIGGEKITINFLSASTFTDNSGNGLVQVPLTGYLSAFQYIDPFWSSFFDNIADYILLGIIATTIGNIVAAQYYKASTTSIWTTIAYLQMISLAPLLSVHWPNFVDTFVGKLSQNLNLEFLAVPNLIFNLGIAPAGTKVALEPALSPRYAVYYHLYSNFFYLAGRKMVLWLGLLMTYPFIWYLKRNYADKHKFCKLWEKLELRFRYTFLLRGMLLSYLSALLASTLNIYNMQFANTATTISCFASIAFQISMIYLPILIMNILQRNYDRLSHPKFLAQYSTVIDELDLSHPSKYMYYAIFLMRRVVYVFLLVLFANNVILSIACHAASSAVMIIYVLVAKPFKRKITAFLTITGELFVTAFHVVALGITNPNQTDAANTKFGFLIILMLCAYLVLGIVCTIGQVAQDLFTEYRARQQKANAENSKDDDEVRYKKWKKRRQLVKREHAIKEKQKLLDQHEDLVNLYRRQQEEEEERRAREEEEKEQQEAENEEGDQDLTKGWQDEASNYMMNNYGGEGNFADSPNRQQKFGYQQNQDASRSNKPSGPREDYTEEKTVQRSPPKKNNPVVVEVPISRNTQSLRLNKNSGSSGALKEDEEIEEIEEINNKQHLSPVFNEDEAAFDYGVEEDVVDNQIPAELNSPHGADTLWGEPPAEIAIEDPWSQPEEEIQSTKSKKKKKKKAQQPDEDNWS